MSTILCLIAGLLIFICCWFAAYIYEEDVTECSGAIYYVPASVARPRLTELAAMKARAEKAEAEVKRLKELLRIESAASAHALLWAEKAEDDTLRFKTLSQQYWHGSLNCSYSRFVSIKDSDYTFRKTF